MQEEHGRAAGGEKNLLYPDGARRISGRIVHFNSRHNSKLYSDGRFFIKKRRRAIAIIHTRWYNIRSEHMLRNAAI